MTGDICSGPLLVLLAGSAWVCDACPFAGAVGSAFTGAIVWAFGLAFGLGFAFAFALACACGFAFACEFAFGFGFTFGFGFGFGFGFAFAFGFGFAFACGLAFGFGFAFWAPAYAFVVVLAGDFASALAAFVVAALVLLLVFLAGCAFAVALRWVDLACRARAITSWRRTYHPRTRRSRRARPTPRR